MAKGKGKKFGGGHTSNPQSSSSRVIQKSFRMENKQQASRTNLDSHSIPTVAPRYGFVPAYPNVPAFPSAVIRNAIGSWPAVHGEQIVSVDQLSGYIFMCNGRTKADCYRYRVFGLPAARMDVVEKIKPRMKLFLFDFDLKLLHGIYIAASNGEMAIEPTAFGGRFSAQVRFEIFKDCLPLPESAFKHIIKDNYQGGNKFKQELSDKQVTNLIALFRPIAMSAPAAEPPGFQVSHAPATKIQSMHLSPLDAQLRSELFYPAEAHQVYRPEYPALPSQDPHSRYVAVPRDSQELQFSAPSHRHTHLPSSTRTAAYWAAVASESLKQEYPTHYRNVVSESNMGQGVPVTSEGAALTPPPTVLENRGGEILQQQPDTANEYHHNPAVASVDAIVQTHAAAAAVPLQYQAPSHGPTVHLPPPPSSLTAGYWTTVASTEDTNLVYSVPYQWQQSVPYQWQQPSASTGGVGAEIGSESSTGAGLAPPPYSANDNYNHNMIAATANGPMQAHDWAAYYSYNHQAQAQAQAPTYAYGPTHLPSSSSQEETAYWTAGAYQGPNQLSTGSYEVLPPTSGGLGSEHLPSSLAGAAAAATANE